MTEQQCKKKKKRHLLPLPTVSDISFSATIPFCMQDLPLQSNTPGLRTTVGQQDISQKCKPSDLQEPLCFAGTMQDNREVKNVALSKSLGCTVTKNWKGKKGGMTSVSKGWEFGGTVKWTAKHSRKRGSSEKYDCVGEAQHNQCAAHWQLRSTADWKVRSLRQL